MFGFLKKKLKDAVSSFTKKAEREASVEATKEEPEHQEIKEKPKEAKEKKPQQEKKSKTEDKKKKEEKTKEKPAVVPDAELEKHVLPDKSDSDIIESQAEERRGFFGAISDAFTKVSLSEGRFNELFWELEIAMLENNVAVEVIEKIKEDLKSELVDKKLSRTSLDKKVTEALHHSLEGLFTGDKINLLNEAKKKKPYVILVIGINGSGKTTSIAKLANLFKKNNMECVIGACDTFRAAAIQQLEEHASKLGVKVIKHDYGSDPAAVAYDAVEHAKAKGKDVVIIDTAGRLHSNSNLMAELEKISRVSKPDFRLFVGESIAGNDVVEQVKLFNSKIGIDGIILAKADVDEKGGAAISVSYVTGKPILYLGTGQEYDDLKEFDKEIILRNLLAS